MPFRHLKLSPQNRWAKMRTLRSFQRYLDITGALPALNIPVAKRLHRALLDDYLTPRATTEPDNPSFQAMAMQPEPFKLWAGCFKDITAGFKLTAAFIPEFDLDLPFFPHDPSLPCLQYRPADWLDPEAWVFEAYRHADRVALGAVVSPTEYRPAQLIPIARAPCSGRLRCLAIVLCGLPQGLGYVAEPDKAWSLAHPSPIESLVLYNP